MMDHITLPSIYTIFHITSSSTCRTNIYLTVSMFFIDEIADSRYSFKDSLPTADIMPFDIGLHLIKLKKSLRKTRQTVDSLETLFKRGYCKCQAAYETRGTRGWILTFWLIKLRDRKKLRVKSYHSRKIFNLEGTRMLYSSTCFSILRSKRPKHVYRLL